MFSKLCSQNKVMGGGRTHSVSALLLVLSFSGHDSTERVVRPEWPVWGSQCWLHRKPAELQVPVHQHAFREGQQRLLQWELLLIKVHFILQWGSWCLTHPGKPIISGRKDDSGHIRFSSGEECKLKLKWKQKQNDNKASNWCQCEWNGQSIFS